MALRMINGTFDQFEVSQFGNSGGAMEDELDQTTVECWYKPLDRGEENKISMELNLPFSSGDF